MCLKAVKKCRFLDSQQLLKSIGVGQAGFCLVSWQPHTHPKPDKVVWTAVVSSKTHLVFLLRSKPHHTAAIRRPPTSKNQEVAPPIVACNPRWNFPPPTCPTLFKRRLGQTPSPHPVARSSTNYAAGKVILGFVCSHSPSTRFEPEVMSVGIGERVWV